MSSEAKKSSLTEIHPHAKTPLQQFKMPTWGLILVLIITMIVLKLFIYIKDGKRDGK